VYAIYQRPDLMMDEKGFSYLWTVENFALPALTVRNS
jgi:hypothetical protein